MVGARKNKNQALVPSWLETTCNSLSVRATLDLPTIADWVIQENQAKDLSHEHKEEFRQAVVYHKNRLLAHLRQEDWSDYPTFNALRLKQCICAYLQFIEKIPNNSPDAQTHLLSTSGSNWNVTEERLSLTILASLVWSERVHPWLFSTRPFEANGVLYRGSIYGSLPKIVASFSWIFGSPPRTSAGEKQPFHSTLLPAKHRDRPHKAAFWVTHRAPRNEQTSRRTRFILGPLASVIAVLVLSSNRGFLFSSSARQIAKIVAPGTPRNLSRTVKDVIEALEELRTVDLHIPGYDQPVPIFSISYPTTDDTQIQFGVSCVFQQLLLESKFNERQQPTSLLGPPFRGEFMVNLSKIVRLPRKRPALLRYYLRCAALWNAVYRPGLSDKPGIVSREMKAIDLNEWLVLANHAHQGTTRLLAARTYQISSDVDRRRLNDARKDVLTYFGILSEQGLVSLTADELHRLASDDGAIPSSPRCLRPVPPADWEQARWERRKEGCRPIPFI